MSRRVQRPRACVKRADTRADARKVGDARIFTRRRGFTALTVLLAAIDLAAVAAGAALWYVADAERHGDNMPWAFGITVVLALLTLLAWAGSAGQRREALALGTLLVIAAALIALFG